MKSVIEEVLKKLNQDGNKSYIVGGAVRSILNNSECTDIDIATTCNVTYLKMVFPDLEISNFLGSKCIYKGFHLDITHLRSDITIEEGYPVNYISTNDLVLDSKRRDFTINAIYMDQEFNIIDYVNGYEDYLNKVVRPIGDISIISNDPIRILRAIRFMVTLDMSLDPELAEYIKMHSSLINSIKSVKRDLEIGRIINNINYNKYKEYIESLNINL